jgi:AraC-like DNA-binding protein
MPAPGWQSFNRVMAATVQQLGALVWGDWQVRVVRLHDVVGERGAGPADHLHAWTELSVVSAGRIAYRHDGDERVLEPGAVFCMPGGQRHGWKVSAGPAIIAGYQLQLAPLSPAGRVTLSSFNTRLAEGGWTLPAHPLATVLADELHAQAVAGNAAVPLCCHLVRAHLCWLLERLGGGEQAASPAADAPARERLDRLREHLLEHIAEPLSLSDLAQRFGVGERHLNRLFAAAFGQPLHRFIIDQRLERASHSLAWRDDPVAAVARSVGYDDPGYFGRLFRSRFGTSPERWRQESRKQH